MSYPLATNVWGCPCGLAHLGASGDTVWAIWPASLPVSQERESPSPAGPARVVTCSQPEISRNQAAAPAHCPPDPMPARPGAVDLDRCRPRHPRPRCFREHRAPPLVTSWDTHCTQLATPALGLLRVWDLVRGKGWASSLTWHPLSSWHGSPLLIRAPPVCLLLVTEWNLQGVCAEFTKASSPLLHTRALCAFSGRALFSPTSPVDLWF